MKSEVEGRRRRQTLLRTAARAAARMRGRAEGRALTEKKKQREKRSARPSSSRSAARTAEEAPTESDLSGALSHRSDLSDATIFSPPETPHREGAGLPRLDLGTAVCRELRSQKQLQAREARARRLKEERKAQSAEAEKRAALAAKPWAPRTAELAAMVATQLPARLAAVEGEPQEEPAPAPETPAAGVPSFVPDYAVPKASRAPAPPRAASPDPDACSVCRVASCRCPPPNFNIEPAAPPKTSMQAEFGAGGGGGEEDGHSQCSCTVCGECTARSSARSSKSLARSSTMSASFRSLPVTRESVRRPIRPPARSYRRTADDRDWTTSKVMAVEGSSAPDESRRAAESLARRMFSSSLDLGLRPRRVIVKQQRQPEPRAAAAAAAKEGLMAGSWQPLSQPRVLDTRRRGEA